MTGGTSGFGAIALGHLAAAGQARLLIGARRPPAVGDHLPLDLTRLDDVRAFAAAALRRLDGAPVDILVLNAGIVRADDTGRTPDGFETTFAVNHLAHYLLLRLLLPALADGGRVVLTTSGTHDPGVGAGLATPRHADVGLLARPDHDPGRDPHPRRAGEHAYTASKLCAILTARALAARPEGERLTVLSYDPGQVFGTGLAHGLSPVRRVAWRVMGAGAMRAVTTRLSSTINRADDAGRALAGLALGERDGGTDPPAGRDYAALRRGRLIWPDPSELARDDTLARDVWDASERLLGRLG
ncbi:SDR family NAD(P)-dependent oxidoreductase [Myceligenerans sp. TRM 65318]|uniref:SDR family NAD(P)-dependent oxidoreductase n=2 Tax=Myceligenerans pegani TaxID=2776917 RepID=A0ABR9MS79_9MICO|nr:SDR family NAD(P)-dependent oxidoreductase [Myceligenerans sp. TRM 65318]MBE3016501.1 SDR family NAD(P)-dependent oxidoreductase [Myceligenerans sp. TRM 65318]